MKYTIGYYQFRPALLEPETNLAAIESALSSATADLIVLPELAASGYVFASQSEVDRVAESPIDGPTASTLRRIAAARNVSLVSGFAEKADEGVYNSAMLVNPDGETHIYRKTHLFNAEKRWFLPGDTGLQVYAAKNGARVGMMICFDWYFPESARTLMLRGAQVIAHPANLVLPWCQEAMVTRCLENQLYAVTANRYGEETNGGVTLNFTGQSQVTGPKHKKLDRAPAQTDRLYYCEVDLREADFKGVTPRNDILEDRRTELYER